MIPAKKLIACTFMLIFICMIIPLEQPAQARNYIFTTDSTLSLSTEKTDLGILPIDQTTTTEITITYEYGRFARPEGFPFSGRKQPTMINLSIDDKPDWCNAVITYDSNLAGIGSFFSAGKINLTANLVVSLFSNATAFTDETITIKAEAAQNGNINPSSDTIDISFQAEYIPVISSMVEDSNIQVDAGNSTNITINVKNPSNAAIYAQVKTTSLDNNNFEITISSGSTIDIGQEKNFLIKIKTNESIDEKINKSLALIIEFYPIEDESLIEDRSIGLIHIEVNPIKSDSDFVDLVPYVVGIAVVFVILYLIFTLIVFKRRR